MTTRLSVDGLDLTEDGDLVIVDSPGRFATEVIRLIEELEHAQRLAEKGHASVRAKYSWESSGAILEDALLGVADARHGIK